MNILDYTEPPIPEQSEPPNPEQNVPFKFEEEGTRFIYGGKNGIS